MGIFNANPLGNIPHEYFRWGDEQVLNITIDLKDLQIIQEKLNKFLEKINQVLIQLLNYNFTEFFKAIGNFCDYTFLIIVLNKSQKHILE